MAAAPTGGSRPEDVAAGQQQPVGVARAMLVPVRDLPKQATIDQEFGVPSELSNCIIVPEAPCCIGRRPTGTTLTCVVPEKWTAMSSCHGHMRWEDGTVVFKDTSSNGTFYSKDPTAQDSFSRLPKGESKALQIGDYIMFSQWSNNRTNDELLIYHVKAIPDDLDVKYVKRSSPYRKDVNLKSKTPKTAAKPAPSAQVKPVTGSMALCQHCAKQTTDALSAREKLATQQVEMNALANKLESYRKQAEAAATENQSVRDQLAEHEQVKETLLQVQAELEQSRQAQVAESSASKKKDEQHTLELASAREALDTVESEKTVLFEQLQVARSETEKVTDQLQQAQQQATGKEAALQLEISKLQEQNATLKKEQEQRNNSEVVKLKEEHEAEINRLQKIQLRVEKEAAAWRLKTETVSRTLPDALEKSMIPQLHKAARQCIHKLLQDVNALNDTTASELFGGTPTNVDRHPCTERADHVGHLGQSQHTVCFSSPGHLAGTGADVPQTEMFEGGTGLSAGNAGPSQEEQGPSVSLRHGFALSQGNIAPNRDDAVQASKDPASPLLHGFMRSAKGPTTSAPAQNEDIEVAVVGMTTDETRVSDQKSEERAGLLGRKRNLSDASDDAADDVGLDDADRFAKVTKVHQQNANHENMIAKDPGVSEQDSIEDRSTSALAERLKALKSHETIAC